jgi:Tol biopolymer transport system component
MDDVFVKDLPSGRIWRVSVNAAGQGSANGNNRAPAISADGRYVAFYTIDGRLVAGDTNSRYDVFVADVETGTVQRVSVAADGTQAELDCFSPAMSADGMLVAFHSDSAKLVAGDVNGYADVFVKDMRTGAVVLASRREDGRGARNGDSREAALSADGRLVAFESRADNLVDDTANGKPAVFLKDLHTGAIRRVSMNAQGAQANRQSVAAALSGNGHVFSFESDATNLVDGDLNGATRDVFVGPSRNP